MGSLTNSPMSTGSMILDLPTFLKDDTLLKGDTLLEIEKHFGF